MQFENKFDAMMHVINAAKHSDLDLERITGISRTQVYRWRSGETKKIQAKTFTQVMDSLGVMYDITSNGITLRENKEDNTMQNKIIAQQLRHIEMLEDQLKTFKSRSEKKSPACNYKTVGKVRINAVETEEESANNDDIEERESFITTGDVSMLGYTLEEYNQFTAKELIGLYHPESFTESMKVKNAMNDQSAEYINIKGLRTLRGKNGHWINFMVEYYYVRDRDNNHWNLIIYYRHLNGDAKS